jgi:hypothetical protein
MQSIFDGQLQPFQALDPENVGKASPLFDAQGFIQALVLHQKIENFQTHNSLP